VDLDFSKLHRSEAIGAIAALVLVISVFLPWFDLKEVGAEVQRPNSEFWVCGTGSNSCSAFDTFPILRWLLLLAATAPLILAWIVIRGHELSWPPGEVTAIVGLIALVLIAYNGVIDKPSVKDVGISLTYGYLVAVAAAFTIFGAGAWRSLLSGGGPRKKPPGTI
jgi:hypothetical protein